MNSPAPDSPGAGPARLPLSARLEDLRRRFADQPATLREVIALLEGQAYTLLIILLALPFSPPASVPGSSTPLGLIIAVVAAHGEALQHLDPLAQTLDHLARILTAGDPAAIIDAIGMDDLRSRLARRP